RLDQIVVLLPGEARHGRVALILFQVAAGADDRLVGCDGDVGVGLRSRRRAGVRPGLGGEIFGERKRIFFYEALSDRRHAVVFARALLKIAELQIKVSGVLAPDDGRRRVPGHAIKAMAGAAERRFLLDRIRPSGGRTGEETGHNNATQHAGNPSRADIAPICAPRRLRSNEKAAPLLRRSGQGDKRDQSVVKAITLLPTSESIWALPPEPTTTYCLPSTMYEDGGALTPAPAWNCQSTFPLAE